MDGITGNDSANFREVNRVHEKLMINLILLLMFAFPGPLTLTNPSVVLPPATKGTFYNVHLAPLVIPTGGVPPYSYTLNKKGPVPPAWLKLSPKGVVSGTPTATGTVNFAFTVYDNSASSSGRGSVNVKPEPIPAVVKYRSSNAQ